MDEERQDETPTDGRSPAPAPSRPSVTSSRMEMMRAVGNLGSVGLSFVIALVIGAAIGLWLDKITGWSPAFFIVFFLIGLAAGIRNVYVITKRFMK